MTKRRTRPQDKLPKHPPKKTGKRGVKPLDTETDFNEPTTKPVQGELLNPPATQPRQKRLPQMEDPQIEELEGSAENYADIRDQRMELTKEEVAAKDELLGLMKKHGKVSYVHNGYDIKVIVESEKLKVRIKKED